MKFSLAVALLAADVTVASSWFSKAAYNKWHQTELERWLSDHNVPYPTPADRKDLQDLVKTNWDAAVASPYVNWDTNRLQKYIQGTGQQVQKGAEKNKNALVNQVKSSWTDTSDSASNAYGSVKDWIFDSWTDSQLKSFADRHSIPVPQPRKRDTLLKSVRENYQSVANKLGETAAYPGDWLYAAWSDSDLKAFLDERGIPAPQPNTRDKLIASVRRNARAASLTSKSAASSLSSSAEAAQTGLTEKIFDTWSDSELKNWADKNGIKVPRGSTRNEILAIARKNAAKLTGDNASAAASGSGSSVTSKGASAMGAATSSAGNAGARATEDASLKANNFADAAYNQLLQYYEDAQIALGLKTNYASSASKSAASASKSAASAYAKASKDAKGEL